MAASGVRREKAARSSGCKSHPATAPAGSNRSSHGGDEMAEAFAVWFGSATGMDMAGNFVESRFAIDRRTVSGGRAASGALARR
jgi:hypothetical protein